MIKSYSPNTTFLSVMLIFVFILNVFEACNSFAQDEYKTIKSNVKKDGLIMNYPAASYGVSIV